VLGVADTFLLPFRCRSTSISSAWESKASKSIPLEIALQLVVEDADWVENVEAIARKKWKLKDEMILSKSFDKWSELASLYVSQSTRSGCPQFHGHNARDCPCRGRGYGLTGHLHVLP
jgi:hypothetical protein